MSSALSYINATCMHAKSLQSCPSLHGPMDCSLAGSCVQGKNTGLGYHFLPDPGIKPVSPVSPALASGFFTTEPPGTFYTDKLESP